MRTIIRRSAHALNGLLHQHQRHSFASIRVAPPKARNFCSIPLSAPSLPAPGLRLNCVSIALRPPIRAFSSETKMGLNGDVRQKRKGSPVNIQDRPTKLLKPIRSDTVNSDQSVDSQYMYGSDSVADAMIDPITTTGENAEWQATIEQVVKNVVSIHFCQTCSFDTSSAFSSEATGFVVDAAKGYILTNRHVVGSGPFSGYCIFDNHEEVSSA